MPGARAGRRGSSPRVRGKPGVHAGPGRVHGLIPACAGKTLTVPRIPPCPQAHPRVCGENPHAGNREREGAGSSPRVRGKPIRGQHGQPGWGLIPACAGKTRSIPGQGTVCRAHPRVCGENVTGGAILPGVDGSSPRVRGKRRLSWLGISIMRLIPACAGKTMLDLGPTARGRAHPRVCGENV